MRWQNKWGVAPAGDDGRSGPIAAGVAARFDSLCAVIQTMDPRPVFVYMPHVRYFDRPARLLYPERREFYRAFAARNGAMLVDPTDRLLAEFGATAQPAAWIRQYRDRARPHERARARADRSPAGA